MNRSALRLILKNFTIGLCDLLWKRWLSSALFIAFFCLVFAVVRFYECRIWRSLRLSTAGSRIDRDCEIGL
jgi:hypothetical protein